MHFTPLSSPSKSRKTLNLSAHISFQESTIARKLSRAKAKLKLINVNEKRHYELKLSKLTNENTFSLENPEESKVYIIFKIHYIFLDDFLYPHQKNQDETRNGNYRKSFFSFAIF